MRRFVLVLLVLIVGAAAQAQTASVVYRTGREALTKEGQALTTTNLAWLARRTNTGTVARTLRWGQVVPYVGTALFVAGVIADAVDLWQLSSQTTGTPLDTFEPGGAASFGCPSPVWPSFSSTYTTTRYWPSNNADLSVCTSSLFGTSYGVSLDFGIVSTSELTARILRSGSAVAPGGNIVAGPGVNDTWLTVVPWPAECGGAYSGSASTQCAKDETALIASAFFQDFLDSHAPSGGSLGDLIESDGTVADAVRDQVLPWYFDTKEAAGSFPWTYAEPLQDGIEMDAAPNANQWHDNPWADPSIDTDGDGYTDWEEVVAGTDPTDAASVPTVTPDPNRDTDGDGYPDWYETDQGTDPNDALSTPATAAPELEPDRDGDGVADMYDPCPFDATNACADATDLEGVAQEETQVAVLSELGNISDKLDAEAPPAQSAPTLLAWLAPTLAADAWASVQTHVTTSTNTFVAAVEPKIPFLAGPWLPLVSFGTAGTCDAIPLSILGTTHDVGMCATPVHSFLAGTGRLVLLALLAFGWHMSVAVLLTET